MTVPRGTRPDNRVIPLYPMPDPWDGQDPLVVSSTERMASRLSGRERAAGYAHFAADALGITEPPPRRRKRHRYGRAALIGALAGALLGAAAWYAQGAEPISGMAQTVDGDTIRIGNTRIRLFGIDAPESQQTCGTSACGMASTNAMRAMLARDPHVTCHARDTDRYGRTVAVCRNSDGELNARMVMMGWAIDYTRYSHGAYRDQEAAAKAERLGMWAAGTFQSPEVWRRESKR